LTHVYYNKFLIICVRHILYKEENRDPAKIHLVHLLADENEYIDDSFLVVLS